MRVEFSPPDITQAEIDQVVEALKSGWITTGPKTKELEREVAQLCGTNKACCLNSATAALEMCLRLLGIGEGDEVIVPAYTYTATVSPVCHVGATPVMVDVAPGSYQMDYDAMEAAITERTKAVIPVDLGGVPCDYDRIFAAVEAKRDLYHPAEGLQQAFDRCIVITDAAHAYGASYKGTPVGSVADFSSFSFHAVKNFTTAEGGALTWRSREGIDDEAVYKQLQLFSLHGQSKDALSKMKLGSWEYDVVAPYFKCNMTDVLAAIGLGQQSRYKSCLLVATKCSCITPMRLPARRCNSCITSTRTSLRRATCAWRALWGSLVRSATCSLKKWPNEKWHATCITSPFRCSLHIRILASISPITRMRSRSSRMRFRCR